MAKTPVVVRKPNDNPRKITGLKPLFKEIWEDRPHVSQISEKPLLVYGHPRWHWQFSHILPKSLYPQYELNPENVILKTVEEHTMWTVHLDKIVEMRDAQETGVILLPHWAWVINLRDRLKKEYYDKFHQQKTTENDTKKAI